jgi:hypothetical protein
MIREETWKPAANYKRKFTKFEDRIILEMVEGLGRRDWGAIAERLGSRSARQCRERWKHYLKPSIKNSEWSGEEDAILEREYAVHGPKWSIISSVLPGRTEVNVKNRWARLCRQKKKKMRAETEAAELMRMRPMSELKKHIATLGPISVPLRPIRMDVVPDGKVPLPSIRHILELESRMCSFAKSMPSFEFPVGIGTSEVPPARF